MKRLLLIAALAVLFTGPVAPGIAPAEAAPPGWQGGKGTFDRQKFRKGAGNLRPARPALRPGRPGYRPAPGLRPGTPGYRPAGRPPGVGVIIEHRRQVRKEIRKTIRRRFVGRVVAGIVLGTVIRVAVAGRPPAPPSPDLCWFWSNSSRRDGYWYYCSGD